MIYQFPNHLQGPQARINQNCCRDCCGHRRGNSGCLRECWGTAAETAGGTAVLWSSEQGQPPGSLHSSSPSTPSSNLNFPRSFRGSLRSSFGESGLGGLVDGWGKASLDFLSVAMPADSQRCKKHHLRVQSAAESLKKGQCYGSVFICSWC